MGDDLEYSFRLILICNIIMFLRTIGNILLINEAIDNANPLIYHHFVYSQSCPQQSGRAEEEEVEEELLGSD